MARLELGREANGRAPNCRCWRCGGPPHDSVILAALAAVVFFALYHGPFRGSTAAAPEQAVQDNFYPAAPAVERAELSRLRPPAGFQRARRCVQLSDKGTSCFVRIPSVPLTVARFSAWVRQSGLRLRADLGLIPSECRGHVGGYRHLPHLTLDGCVGFAFAGKTLFTVGSSSLLLATRHGVVGTRLSTTVAPKLKGTEYRVTYMGVPRPSWYQEP
jgi:hypothetical protein